MSRKRLLVAIVAIVASGAAAYGWVHVLFWRHIPARHLPFTRSWLYGADVDDAKLATLTSQDLGRGTISTAPGMTGCATVAPDIAPAQTTGLVAVEIADAKNPVAMATQCGSDVLWIAEQNGKVRPLLDGILGSPALDITQRMFRPASGLRGWEMGLEGIAFSPDGARLYVSYSDDTGATRVSEFPAPSGPNDVIDPETERTVIAVAQPDDRHNGGTIRFGPDGFLYFGLGDGGSRCGIMSAFPGRLYGKIIRIDPRKQPDGATYGIPASNPFARVADPLGPRPEVWLTGIRNPWGFGVDSVNGDLWVSDVGEFDVEEVNHIPAASAGAELGWPLWEGALGPREMCMFEWAVAVTSEPMIRQPRSPDTKPTYSYEHRGYNAGDKRCSVTGGDVYHGALYPRLRGKFLFADFCSGELLALGANEREPLDTMLRLPLTTAIAQDQRGHIWVTDYNGKIRRIDPAE